MLVVSLDSATDSNKFGGKAANLAKMIKASMPVPAGFALSIGAFEKGLDEDLKRDILAAFDDLGCERVAVRSSAVAEDSSEASWAGQLDSLLNVGREELIDAIKECWESIKSVRAQSYAKDHKVPKSRQKVAVVVQVMVDASAAGVVFTANPISGEPEEMMIEAVYGLGEYLVQGIVTPENYIINKKTKKIITYSPHRQTKMLVYKNGKNQEAAIQNDASNVLNEKQIKKLVETSKQIETLYGKPQDIEFAFDGDRLYIVQSRPITTLDEFKLPEFFQHCAKSIRRPSTLQRDELFRATSNNVAPAEVVSLPLGDMNRAYYLEKTGAKKIFEVCLNSLKTRQNLTKHINNFNDVEKLAGSIAKFIEENPKKYRECFKKYREFQIKLSPFLYTALAVDAILYPQFKENILTDYPKKSEEILNFVATPKNLHDYQKFRLALCKFKLKKSGSINSLLEEFGHINEYSFVEKLTTAEDIHKELKNLNEEVAEIEIKDIEHSIDDSDTKWLEKLLPEEIFVKAILIKEYALLRTSRIDFLKRVQLKLRAVYESMAFEFKANDAKPWTKNHLVNLLDREIDDYINNGEVPAFDEISKRLDQSYLYFFTNNKTTVITDQKIIEKAKSIVTKPEDFESQSIISPGTTAFAGSVKGRVVKVTHKDDLNKVKSGDIIVAHVTMPEYTAVMKKAAGFITAEGGITSHAAIVARELAKPCIVGADNCMQVLKTGDYIFLDSANQKVHFAQETDFDIGEPEDLFYWGPSRARPLYMNDFIMAVEDFFIAMFKNSATPNPPKTLALFHNKQVVWLINERAFGEFVLDTFTVYKNQKRIDRDVKDWQKACRQLDTGARDTKEVPNLLIASWRPTLFAEFSLYGAEMAIAELLKRFNEKTRQEIWGNFTIPDKPTFINRIDQELLKSKDVEQLAKKYYWIQSGYEGVVDSAEEYFTERLKVLKGNEDKKNKQSRGELAKRLKLTEEELSALELTRKLAKFMDDRKAWMMKSRQYLSDLPTSFVKFNNGWLFEEGKSTSIKADDAKELWERYVDFKASTMAVKGIVASNGGKHFINGEVALVSSPTDSVEDDRILVVPSTSPSYVPLMRNARALITDHGGMMSHAAIVAREFGLPCIVGTKQATKILRAGDKVVLDLVKGIVNL